MKIKINNKEYNCKEGQTVMQVAHKNGIEIPGFCGHPDFKPKGNCRVCVVEVKGVKRLATSCSTKVFDGMEVNKSYSVYITKLKGGEGAVREVVELILNSKQ